MHQQLKLESFGILVRDDHGCVQAVLVQSNAVDQVELIGPERPDLFVERGGAQTKVELNIGVAALVVASGGGLGRRLAHEFPFVVAREAMLGQLGCCFVIGCSAEDLVS